MEPDIIKKGWPTRFLSWLFTWRTARRSLVAVAVMGTVIAIFYAEENWRGQRVWEQCKQELTAQGARLDWADFVPKLIPDDENIFKAPFMEATFVQGSSAQPKLFVDLNKTNNTPIPVTKLTAAIARDYLADTDQFEADLNVVREALKRPHARIDGDYDHFFVAPVVNFVAMRSVSHLLAKRAQCHLVLGESDKALAELQTIHQLCRLLDHQVTGGPTFLVTAMIDVAINGLYARVVADGLSLNAWNPAQLLALQAELAEVDLPSEVVRGFQCELAATCGSLEMARYDPAWWHKANYPYVTTFGWLPRGWIQQNMATVARLEFQHFQGVDLTNQIIHVAEQNKTMAALFRVMNRPSPFNFIARMVVPNSSRAWQATAQNQTYINLALITCGLERYHVANGRYPASLAALVPAYLESVPHDLIEGQPLHYRLMDNGKFLLYSVGWDGKDDGGQVKPGDHLRQAMTKGDWLLIGATAN